MEVMAEEPKRLALGVLAAERLSPHLLSDAIECPLQPSLQNLP